MKVTDPLVIANARPGETPYDGVRADEVIYQRACPAGCAYGLLLAPARFCPVCSGTGFSTRTVSRVNPGRYDYDAPHPDAGPVPVDLARRRLLEFVTAWGDGDVDHTRSDAGVAWPLNTRDVEALIHEVDRLSAIVATVVPMTENPAVQQPVDAPDLTEVAVETPAKNVDTVEVVETAETVGAAEPDDATKAMDVEDKEHPSA